MTTDEEDAGMTINDVVSEMIEDMGLHEIERSEVTSAVRACIEVSYEDAMSRSAQHSRELSERREQLCRDVWHYLDLGAYPW